MSDHPKHEPCPTCRERPCPLCAAKGTALDLPGDALELPEVDLDALLDPYTGMPLRERLRARAHALAGDLEQLDGPEADDLAARLAGFLTRLDATVPGSTGDPATKRRRARR